jgi:hypothetical protein
MELIWVSLLSQTVAIAYLMWVVKDVKNKLASRPNVPPKEEEGVQESVQKYMTGCFPKRGVKRG